jgi:hypothetical protein
MLLIFYSPDHGQVDAAPRPDIAPEAVFTRHVTLHDQRPGELSPIATVESVKALNSAHVQPHLDRRASELDKSLPTHAMPDSQQTYSLGGSFTVFSLDDCPEYIALSYVWGTESFVEKFLLNGVEVNITCNLADALQQIQSPDNNVVVWVDAVSVKKSLSRPF